MKKLAWVFLIGLWCGSLAMAQIGNFSQRGKATQELKTDGISIAHPSLPLNSTATVTNTTTGKSVEATVTGRVPASPNRIADLSPGAWKELGLDANSEITISTAPRPRTRAIPATPPAETAAVPAEPTVLEPAAPAEPAPQVAHNDPAASEFPIHITLHNFITVPEDKKTPQTFAAPRRAPPPHPVAATPPQTPQKYVPDPDLQRRLAVVGVQSQPLHAAPPPVPVTQPKETPAKVTPPQPVVVPSYHLTVAPVYQTQQMTTVNQPPPAPPPPPPPPPPLPAYQPQTMPVYQPQPMPSLTTVRVIPGYPDPASGRIFNLQVGAYSTADAANKAERLIRSHGFNVSQDLSKPYYRIIVTGVPAAMVYATVQRLGSLGVEEVIIR